MSTAGLGFNPVHCLRCNLEVVPETLVLDPELVEAIAAWYRVYGAIDALEIASGFYEAWARVQLLDPGSPPNVEGRDLARRLNAFRRCYFWFWQPESDDDFTPRSTCPVCARGLTRGEVGVLAQLLCEHCDVVLTAGANNPEDSPRAPTGR